jgi:Zn-dependent protease
LFENLPIATILVSYVAVLFALSIHEAAHATSAYLLGDDTAASLGRMTLNPIAHMDWLGTLLMPLIGMVTGARVIGWAKPVPVDTSRLTRRFRARVGYAMVAAAGPASNLIQSLIFLVALTLFIRFAIPADPKVHYNLFQASMFVPVEQFLQDGSFSGGQVLAMTLLGRLVIINVGLAIFNLLPFGPLDGAGILRGFLPYRWLATFDRIQPTITIVLLILFFVGAMGFILGPLYFVAEHLYILPLARLILGV